MQNKYLNFLQYFSDIYIQGRSKYNAKHFSSEVMKKSEILFAVSSNLLILP